MPSNTDERPFSAFLRSSQLAATCSASSASVLAEHVGVAAVELVVHAAGDVGEGELARLGGEGGVEHDLEQQVAQLLLEVLVALAGLGVDAVEGVDDLVGLLEQVALERLVGLLLVPRALPAQRGDQLGEALDLHGDRGDVGRGSTPT